METIEDNNNALIEQINRHQNCVFLHPLTCGNDSKHQNLVPEEQDGRVVLVCNDCDYVQKHNINVAPLSVIEIYESNNIFGSER